MSRKNISYARGDEHSDFGDLLSELQGKKDNAVMVDGTAAIASPSPIVTFPVKEESEERHRIMSNQKIKYLYSKQINVIHDKHCNCVKYIPDEDLLWAEEYVSELKPCSDCMIQAYVAAGAKDPEEMDKYFVFFKKTQMSKEQIRSIYVENGMKTRILVGVMTVWYKEDTWRIKCLPKQGHVQLYHNNYAVKKNGVREFTQGFHVQNPACLDTNIRYALDLIKKYEYKPEEYALHNRKVNPIEKKKANQQQAGKMKMTVVPLEELLSGKMEEQTLWQKLKSYVMRLFKKQNFFVINDFQLVSKQGYPKNQTICIYIWKDRNEQLFWQTGIYDRKRKQFSVSYGTTAYAINQEKVVAWKKMNADALEIEDNKN